MMKLYRSLVYRELRLTRKKYLLMFILFVLLEALFTMPAFQKDLFFYEMDEIDKYLLIAIFTVVPSALGSFIAGSNNGVHKADINAGWKRYSFVLPVTSSQKAAADLIVKLMLLLLFGVTALAQVMLYGAFGLGRTAVHTVNMFIAVGAISLLFDTAYCGLIMLAKDKDDLKLFVIFASGVGLGLLMLVEKLMSFIPAEKGENGELISEDALKSILDFIGSGRFTIIAAAAFIVMCVVYFAVLHRVHGRREP